METAQTKNQSSWIVIAIVIGLLGIFGYLAYSTRDKDTSSVGKEKVDYTSGTTVGYNLNKKTFTLTHPAEVYPMPRDSASWAVKMEPNNANFGILMWYFATGKDRMLTNPYIQVSYVSKHATGSSTIDSLYIWLDNLILKTPESKVLRNRFSIPVPSGKMLECKEYSWGKRSMDANNQTILDSKYVAYAYMDFDEDYWIGYALTTKEKDKFDMYLPHFYYITKSFK